MIGILFEVLRPLARGQRAGFRVRIKPSWSGRVYGTYQLTGRHFALAATLIASTGSLFYHLLALNLADPRLEVEESTLRRSAAHGQAMHEIRWPAAQERLQGRAEDLDALGHKLRTALGLRADGSVGAAGLGRIEEAEPASPHRVSLERLVGDVSRIDRDFGQLGLELASRETELRYHPSIVPVFQAEFVPTSGFGPRISPFTHLPEIHRGQDLAAEMYTKIVATADGIVVYVEQDASRSRMGRYVVIDHDGRFQTSYGHCERVFVELGQHVTRHQIIAEVGNTGRSTGPHVHYEVRLAGEPRDPRQFMVFDSHFNSEEQIRFE